MEDFPKEGEEMIAATGDEEVRDAGLISSARRVEHYEKTALMHFRRSVSTW
jgi:ferritin-like metal-binding protein YciE